MEHSQLHSYRTWVAFLLIIILSSSAFAQEKGKIGGFDDEAKPGMKDTAQAATTSSSSVESDDEFSIQAVLFIGELFGYLFIQFPGEDAVVYGNTFWTRGFTLYPYADPEQGMFSAQSEKSFAFSFSGHYFTDRSNLTGYGGKLFVSPHQSINLEAQVTDLSEKLTTKTDHLRLYSFFIDYNRVKAERFSLWWGLGIKGMNGPTVRKTGFAFNTGMEIFPISPVSLCMSYNVGSVNNRALHEFVATADCYINRFGLTFGYRRFTVGSAVLDGMIVGGAMHF